MRKVKDWFANAGWVLGTILILALLVIVLACVTAWWTIASIFYITTGIPPKWVDWKNVKRDVQELKETLTQDAGGSGKKGSGIITQTALEGQ